MQVDVTSRGYRTRALAGHMLNPDMWPFFVDKAKGRLRRLTGQGRPVRHGAESAIAYGGAHEMSAEDAVRTLGLPGLRDPRVEHPDAFEAADRRVAAHPVRFKELGLAGAGQLDVIYTIVAGLSRRRVLETGVALGWSSLAILLGMGPDGRLVSVDMPYPYLAGGSWVGMAVPPELAGRWKLIRRPDRAGLPQALKEGPFDFIHYDSDKAYEGRRRAYPLLWRALAPGGVLMSDDVSDNLAWADFCKDVGLTPVAVRRGVHGFSSFIVKPG